VQGYSSFTPFNFLEFTSLYLQIPVLLVFFAVRKKFAKTRTVDTATVDLQVDEYEETAEDEEEEELRKAKNASRYAPLWRIYEMIA
jgi:amino acid transporter, AAT family